MSSKGTAKTGTVLNKQSCVVDDGGSILKIKILFHDKMFFMGTIQTYLCVVTAVSKKLLLKKMMIGC